MIKNQSIRNQIGFTRIHSTLQSFLISMAMIRLVFSLGVVFLIFFSCKNEPLPSPIEQEVTIDDEVMLLGSVDRELLRSHNYVSWYDSSYQAYSPLTKVLDSLNLLMDGVDIEIIFGTWCSDSKRDVPALFKILDQTSYDQNKISMIATDRTKTLPESELDGFEIEYVPTIILSRAGQELGRIIEFPQRTLEEDMLEMVKG